ncbi:MAG TPA: hypothetical protein PK397_03115 [Ignavibacteriaceae bacterium]|jgi:hypothetical protein|nr:hypothetical protein [Ignavibacteriaceae bacterium]
MSVTINKVVINSESNLPGFAASVVIHILILFGSYFILELPAKFESAGFNYIQIREIDYSKSETYEVKEELAEERTAEEKSIDESTPSPEKEKVTAFFPRSDTTSLKQIYKESTLNVRIKYPLGWSFLDQNVKNKLDGVTFLGPAIGDKTPPYVHIEVNEKYLFNPSRYKYTIKTDKYDMYYNDPEELENQVTQIVYIRTGDDEDYSVKLIVHGMDAFREYQPVFFGMIKTFKFGSRFF